MKAILEFNLPDDQPDFQLAVDGSKWSYVAWQIDQELRAKLKYDENISEDTYNELQKLRDKLYDFINSSGLTFDNL